MALGSDVHDILELEGLNQDEFITKDALFNKKKVKKTDPSTFKKPEGMHRELWGLLWTDSKDAPPIIPSDMHPSAQGYKQLKAKIGQSRVRPWKWMPFTNPARKDGAVLHHWRRVADEGLEYPFARFNKQVEIPSYSAEEYVQYLLDEGWSQKETNYLFEMARRYDLRFVVMHDRWDKDQSTVVRSIEDLKERYYGVAAILADIRGQNGGGGGGESAKVRVFDAEHERRRKEQLEKLFRRTEEQIEEEEYLVQELKKIEQRKKEREKKTQDLQKLIIAADSNLEARRSDRKMPKKKFQHQQRLGMGIASGSAGIGGSGGVASNIIDGNRDVAGTAEGTGVKFPDFKQSGVSLHSQRMKLPATIGQKKTKAIEQVVEELGIELNPMPTEQIVEHYNEMRQNIVLLYELRLALANCQYELQTLSHRYEQVAPGKALPSSVSNVLKQSQQLQQTAGFAPLGDTIFDGVGGEMDSSPKLVKRQLGLGSSLADLIEGPGTADALNRKLQKSSISGGDTLEVKKIKKL